MQTHDEWITNGYEDLELSTQLLAKEALCRGYSVEVLDRGANFIRVSGKDRIEYVRQATRTRADSYIAPLIMENKKVTKLILAGSGIRVPEGRDYTNIETMLRDFPFWQTRGKIVVKPNTTNFGVAVSILDSHFAMDDFARACKKAFDEDESVLAEEFIEGKEYRFLVIDGITRAVLHRVPANVTGDGTSSVGELIELKNADPRRGERYHSPLEKIRTGAKEELYLRAQGLDFNSVIGPGETVCLRQNSNISTGGDSVDFTDIVHPGYGEIAAASAAAVGARICGADMMIADTEAEPDGRNYAIIELNFNPALHIHDFPFSGKNRAVEKHVLDALELR